MSKHRICIDCQFAHTEYITTQQGAQKIMICTSEDCRDLVSGDNIPCGAARREDVYCGVGGKYFKIKVKENPLKAVEPTGPATPTIQIERK